MIGFNIGGFMFHNDWDIVLKDEIKKDYFQELLHKVSDLYTVKTIYPPKKDVFNAFRLSYKDVKVVIIGQDPYHEEGEAHGLAFSCLKTPIPPSLKNIYKELYTDLGIKKDMNDGNLIPWFKQGVMLLNSTLTVEKGLANSHQKFGWSIFTDEVIRKLNKRDKPLVFILWGNNARAKKQFITNPKHLVIESGHPSPLSCKFFFGSKPFSRTNKFLIENKITPIKW